MANEKRLVDINKFPLLPSRLEGDMSEYERGYLDAQANMNLLPTVDAVEVVHGWWEDGRCSNCNEEALSTSWDEPIYDYDWEENLRYAYTETHKEYHLTDYCPNCGAKMDGGQDNGSKQQG